MELAAHARRTLEGNQHGDWTRASHFYVHQWLWDSCFIAIGMATYDPPRAAAELKSLLRGQWSNGMVPHIVFADEPGFWQSADFWQSSRMELAPAGIETSGMTQPPMLAIAAERVYQQLPKTEGKRFLTEVVPKIVAHHQWIYRERDPRGTGLAVLVHPWESGLDNTPPWMKMLERFSTPWWLALALQFGAEQALNFLREDAKKIPVRERETNLEAIKSARLSLEYRKLGYDTAKILKHPHHIAQESLIFNCVLIRANQALARIAKTAAELLPPELIRRAQLTEQALEQLWDEPAQRYFPRDFDSGELIRVPAVTELMPLYTGVITKSRAQVLVKLLTDPAQYWSAYPVPSTPLDSAYFDEDRYWRGPTWLNINWFLIQGLSEYGFKAEARQLLTASRQLAEREGFREYYSPFSGEGFGSGDFSWSAALTLDFERLAGEL